MDNRAIGVFDSGLGGLTAVKELHKILPNENIVLSWRYRKGSLWFPKPRN